MERACGSLRGLQVGPTSAEDEGCVLQGCDPAWRFSEPVICLPRVYVPSEESAGERRSFVCWLPARGQPESAHVHQPVYPALGASPSQRQIPARFGQRVQSVHRRLDQLLRPVLSDAIALDPQEDRCLCHPLGAPEIQTVASPNQRGARLVCVASPRKSNSVRSLAAMSWQRPNIGSRMNREVHVRFWERAEVQLLRATRHNEKSPFSALCQLPPAAAATRGYVREVPLRTHATQQNHPIRSPRRQRPATSAA